jgi:hypothetical protein
MACPSKTDVMAKHALFIGRNTLGGNMFILKQTSGNHSASNMYRIPVV